MNPDASGIRVVSFRIILKNEVLILLDRANNEEGFTAKLKRTIAVK